MFGFTIIALGQFVSMLGTGMTRFAITIYAWQGTGEATALALVGFFAFGPSVLLSPIGGAMVDRDNRKLVMMLSDLAAGLMTLAVLGLFLTGELQIWHLFVTGALSGAFESFQFPAYSAAVTTMLPKEQYARANGMISLVESASGVVSPILAGGVIGVLGLQLVFFGTNLPSTFVWVRMAPMILSRIREVETLLPDHDAARAA